MKNSTNKTKQSINISKGRSARSILSLSNVLLLSNTWTFCRSLLPSALLMGIVCTIEFLASRFLTGTGVMIMHYFCILLTLYFFSTFIFGFRIMMKEKFDTETSMFSPLSTKAEFKSLFSGALPIFYLFCIIFALVVLLSILLNNFSSVLVVIPVIIVVILLAVPFALALYYMTASDDMSIKKALCYGYHYGKRYFGSTFLILFITTIVSLFLGIIGSLPTLILQWAIMASDTAVAVGDPTNLPSYVNGLSFFFIIFAVAFATLSTLFGWIAGYLHYHSILSKEVKRLEQR